MKPNQQNKKLGKRTYTLKELAQKDFRVPTTSTTSTATVSTENLAPTFSLVGIQEDLLNIYQAIAPEQAADPSTPNVASRTNLPALQNLTLSIDLLNQFIAKEVNRTAQVLDLEELELQAWINLQVMAPKQTLLTLLRLAKDYGLDPLKEEVALALYEDCHWQAYITVEGYSKLLNHHPAFDGIVFNESPESANGIPIWMECTIYRKDRSQTIVVREYFEEVKGEQAIWQKMPRRMLRHRVMAQCARLAVG
jgi:hypothetical protein